MADPIGLVLILLPHDDSTQNLSSLVALLNGMGVGNDRVQVVNTVPVGEPVMDRIRQVDGDIILLNGMVKDVYFLDNFPSSMACSCIVRSLDRTTTLAMKCASWDKEAIILALSKVALISIDSLIEKLSLSYYYFMDIPLSPPPITLDHMIIHSKCHARVGFMGNPSDNFHGKTISFLLGNFYASVTLKPHAGSHIDLQDPCVFESPSALWNHSQSLGYTSGLRLLQATCKVFFQLCQNSDSPEIRKKMEQASGFQLSYQTNIPRMVGMSGSSAIVVATFKALLRHYGLCAADLGLKKAAIPEVILSIERDELGISAGLQDRVIQTYGGLVAMDFGPDVALEHRYTELDPALLPELYLVYNINTGGESGKVHSTVKERWLAKDPVLIEQVGRMIRNTDEALSGLKNGDRATIARCMDQNFALRREIYGDAVVGAQNVATAELCREHGLAAKFTGSGGAFICMRRDGSGWFSDEEEHDLRAILNTKGFEMVRVQLPLDNSEDPLW